MTKFLYGGKRLFFIGLLFFIGMGCTDENAVMQNNLNQMQADLEQRIKQLESIQQRFSKIDPIEKGDFLHEVYFNLKKGITEKE